MAKREITRFFRSYLQELSESLFVQSVISSQRCEQIRAFTTKPVSAEYARQLLAKNRIDIPQLRLSLQLKRLREIDEREFFHIELLVDRPRPRKQMVCFVGHRFTPNISKTLRWNLKQVLEPYNIRLDWSGQDPRSVQIFEDIVKRIKKADFCVFDTRATEGKPNVYIEAGIAYALGTPFMLFEYSPRGRSSETASIPSDLGHALALRYSTYRQLFREFYFSLPAFAKNNLD